MRPQLISRRTRSLVNTQPIRHRAPLSSTHALRYPRKDSAAESQTSPSLSRGSSSPAASPSGDPNGPIFSFAADPSGPPPDEPEERPKRSSSKSKASASSKDADASVALPSGLEILWTPEDEPSPAGLVQQELPRPELFDEILHNLHITLHPQTQHRAAYPASGSPVEPTLALYSPIEGGDNYIDNTVREIARQAGADVVVLDSVQLAAGVCGHFGQAAAALQLPNNPLHFPSTTPSISRNNARAMSSFDEDEDDVHPFFMPSRMTLQLLTPVPSRGARAAMAPTARGGSTAKLKAFFDKLINVSASPRSSKTSKSASRRPRIIYVRDFSTLAPSSSIWWSALLKAVQQRRAGPITNVTSPVAFPTTIVFGITPSIVAPPSTPSSGSGHQGLFNVLTSRQATSSSATAPGKQPKSEYGEDAVSDKAREKRTMNRLKRWARGDPSPQDIPQLSASEDMDESSNGNGKPDVMFLGGPENGGLPSVMSAIHAAVAGRNRNSPSADNDVQTRFFRTSLLLPKVRDISLERATRVSRRREINELTMRMAIAAIGFHLDKMEPASKTTDDPSVREKEQHMWEEWGKAVVPWSTVRRIADRAIGSLIAKMREEGKTVTTLQPTEVQWLTVYEAWEGEQAAEQMRKSIITESHSKILHEIDEDEEKAEEEEEDEDEDEVVERIKRDPELDPHEARLLGSIVDTSSLTTTFGQVHLPDHTIDSVRTIVSLPLLHPAAFQHGLLKEHGMTGCLLFGPPGTGKTLVVRALAKEAGCRMLAITPSDVMDMYVGEGEKLVRAVFSLARKLSPCVVFIDELDALFGARSSRDTGGAIAHRGVITEFMQEMDGLKSSRDNVIVIGATNRPFDLDDAVLRRLPRRLLVDLPGEKEREEILKILLRDEALADDVDLKTLAKKTESFSGSDLKHLCVSAVLDAVKEKVDVPWRPSSNAAPPAAPLATTDASQEAKTEAKIEAQVEAQVEAQAEVQVEATAADAPEKPSTVTAEPSAVETTEAKAEGQDLSAPAITVAPAPSYARTIAWRNFEKALKEITPSASESLGSLADLRKWNEEFGEGRKQRKRVVWGKGRFGFTIEPPDNQEPGKVAVPTTTSADNTEQ
ncbi:AAA-domain-containing protein [Laetiporus sulphureus 93-53]|uniref:AAA-domain-containing protein n=1 Tax=Laetiporus sulphureus 93-53 TaxID=1314785 RepID=A0A165H475_9APHY|nr:AAA-domain-containing protein [Laetiporus sulphureus 93-53]KZT11220.1 AAA-domain-containing protein [Laetiporus sulphureus 93-53]